MILIPKFIVLI